MVFGFILTLVGSTSNKIQIRMEEGKVSKNDWKKLAAFAGTIAAIASVVKFVAKFLES